MYPRTVRREWSPVKTTFAPPSTILTAYNGAAMTHHGTIVIPCSYGKRQCDTAFYVVETPGPVILGLPTSRDLNHVTLNCAVTKGVRREWSPVKTTFAPPSTILTAYNGAAMTHHGTIVIPCSYGKRQCDTAFYVVETPGPVILGLPTSRDLNLVTLNCAVAKGVTINSTDDLKRAYPDRFQGIGEL